MSVRLIEYPFYFYQSLLSGDYLSLYNDAINELSHKHFEASIAMDYDEAHFNDRMKDVIQAIIYDRPELFFISQQVAASYSNGRARLTFQPIYEISQIEEFYSVLDEKTTQIADEISKISDQMEQLYQLNMYLCSEFEGENEYTRDNGNAYGVLTSKTARCEGFCKLGKLVLQKLGFDCFICTGNVQTEDNTIPHAWLAVKYNGRYYAFDYSFNASISSEQIPGMAYTFLNKQNINADRSEDYSYPITDDDSYLFWNMHHGEVYSLRDLGDADTMEYKNCFYTIHHFVDFLEISEYDERYEIPMWIESNASPFVRGYRFIYRYLRKINVLCVYYINE